MSDYVDGLTQLTLNELYRAYASECDAMQGMAATINSDDRTLRLSKLILINNEIREREVQNGN